MCGVIALTFIVTTAAEIALIIKVGSALGVLPTFGLIVVTGIVGAYLARRQGAAALLKLRDSLAGGDPTLALVNGALVLAAGVTLLSPGFITDTAGLLLLLPQVRAPVARFVHSKLASRARAHLGGIDLGVGGIDLGVENDSGDGEDPPPPGVIDV